MTSDTVKALYGSGRYSHTIYMKQLFESLSRTNDGAFVIDGRNRIVFWNKAAEEILGYRSEEVAGLHCYEILGGRDEQGRTLCQRFCQVAIQAKKGDVFPTQDLYVRTKTGEGQWLNLTTFAYSVSDKTIAQVIVHMFRDATEQKNNQRFVDRVLAAATEQKQQDEGFRVLPAAAGMAQKDGLTAREQQVLILLSQGLGTEEVATMLVISPATVRNHVQNILNKLGVHSRLEAIAQAYKKGLLQINKL